MISMVEEVDLKKKFWNVKTFISFLIALIILYMLFSRVDIGRTAKLIAGVNLLLYVLAFAIYYTSYPAALENIFRKCRIPEKVE